MADPRMVDALMEVIRRFESGGRYTARNPNGTAAGAYQMIASTWRSWAQRSGVPGATNYSSAADAPPEMQDAVARWAVSMYLDNGNGDPAYVLGSWYLGHWPPTAAESNRVPAGGNTQTPEHLVNVRLQALNQLLGTDFSFQGGATVAGSGGSATATGTPTLTDDEIAAMFPIYAVLLADPEIGPILREAASRNEDEAWLEARLQNTEWWQARSETARQWDLMLTQDPQTANQRREAVMAELRDIFGQLGFTQSEETIRDLAEQALRLGWTETQITDSVLALVPDAAPGPGTSGPGAGGTLVADMQTIRQSGRDYFHTVSDQTAFEWAKAVAGGTLTMEGITEQFRRQAELSFAWAAPGLQSGFTMAQLMQPMQDTISQTMDLAPQQIDFQGDSYWGNLLYLPGEDGQVRAPTTKDALTLARRHVDYKQTSDAQQRTTNFVETAARRMGAKR
jgi:hypothetical protein